MIWLTRGKIDVFTTKAKKIVNNTKNKDVVNRVLDKFLFSNLATFVVFLGPLLSTITFLAFSIIESSR